MFYMFSVNSNRKSEEFDVNDIYNIIYDIYSLAGLRQITMKKAIIKRVCTLKYFLVSTAVMEDT